MPDLPGLRTYITTDLHYCVMHHALQDESNPHYCVDPKRSRRSCSFRQLWYEADAFDEALAQMGLPGFDGTPGGSA